MKSSFIFLSIIAFACIFRSSYSSLQLGAPWPMRSRNALHLSISPFLGPNKTFAASAFVSTYATTGIISGSIIIDNENNVIFGSENKYLYKLGYDLSLIASYQTAGLIQSTPAIDNAGNIYFAVIYVGTLSFIFY